MVGSWVYTTQCKQNICSEQVYTGSPGSALQEGTASRILVLLLIPTRKQRKGVLVLKLNSFVEAVIASVVAYYICQWLDGLLR